MEKRILGRTQLPVTVLGYGAMELRHLNPAEAGLILNDVLDQGITYIDTSPDYGPSEEMIGRSLSHRRQEFYLASKCGCNVDASGKGQNPAHIWSRKQLLWNIENSLKLLRTDHLDVWQLHGTAPEELPGNREDEVILTLQEIKRQGKAGAIALSFKNGSASDPWYPAGYAQHYLPHFLDFGVFDVLQIVYGGMMRTNEKGISLAASRGVGVVVRGVVKAYQPYFPDLFQSSGTAALCEPGETMSQFLLRFAMSHTGIHTMIVGTRSPAHLAENIRAAEAGPLPAAVYQEASRRLAAAGIAPAEV